MASDSRKSEVLMVFAHPALERSRAISVLAETARNAAGASGEGG